MIKPHISPQQYGKGGPLRGAADRAVQKDKGKQQKTDIYGDGTCKVGG